MEKIDLDHFLEFFGERLKFIRTQCLTRIEGIILVSSYIDSLAGYRYGGPSKFARFRKFLIQDTAQCDMWRNVSLILLRQYVEEKNQQGYSSLIDVLNRLGAITSRFINLNYSPDISLDVLMTECSSELSAKEIKSVTADIKRFEYTAILWNAYRNASVHETAIQLDQAMNIANRTTPFYANRNNYDKGRVGMTRTCFDIPISFLIASVESGLCKLKGLIEDGTCELASSSQYDRPGGPSACGGMSGQ